MLLCNPFDHSCSGFADRGGSTKSQEPAGTSDAVRLDVQYDSGDNGTAAQDRPLDDGASFTLWEAFRGKGPTSTLTNGLTSPPRPPKTDGPNLDLLMDPQ